MEDSLRGNLTEEIYLRLRDRILRGDLPFGSPLSRRKLADELGTSSVPVGDALQRLESEGLVESRPRVGTRVRVPTPKSVRGHYILREALESQAARIYAERATGQERESLAKLAAELDQQQAELAGAEESSPERMFEVHRLHMRFHMRIAEASGCDELYGAIERNQILVFNWLFDNTLKRPAPPPEWHTILANALNSGDPDAADSAMRRHTRYRMDEVLESLDPYFHFDDLRLKTYRGKNGPRAAKLPAKSPATGAPAGLASTEEEPEPALPS
jgi:DNA-binding GntR family transcriptional regulator